LDKHQELRLTYSHNQNITSFAGNSSAPVLVIDKEGFVYKGNRIQDAGEAHKVFLEVMYNIKNNRI